MPKSGFTTISIKDAHYDHMLKWYNESKDIGVLDDGIESFTAFFVKKIIDSIIEQEAMRVFVSKILYVPDKFTETKLVLKQSKL